jgi:hypothetical protein
MLHLLLLSTSRPTLGKWVVVGGVKDVLGGHQGVSAFPHIFWVPEARPTGPSPSRFEASQPLNLKVIPAKGSPVAPVPAPAMITLC